MKVSEICKTVNDCDRLRDILLQDKHPLTVQRFRKSVTYCGIIGSNF